MASLKVFVFVLLSATLFCSHVDSEGDGLKYDGIVDFIKKAEKQIEGIIDTILFGSEYIIDGIGQDFDSVQPKIVKLATDAADLVMSTFVSVTNDISKQSSTSGKHLATCVNAVESDFVGIVTSLTEDFTTCTKDDIINVTSALGPLVNEIKNAYEKIKVVLKNLDLCEGNDASAIICAVNAVTLADDSEIDPIVFKIIENYIPAIWDAGEAFDEAAVQCWTSGKSELLSKAAKVFDKVADCASS